MDALVPSDLSGVSVAPPAMTSVQPVSKKLLVGGVCLLAFADAIRTGDTSRIPGGCDGFDEVMHSKEGMTTMSVTFNAQALLILATSESDA